ncbi:MAG: ABC transporter substrate-binding protein [Gammaproteobacteria bacterium]|nr:ABC transporter substrate-binding protein [Gammaproteobacteria bacterium]
MRGVLCGLACACACALHAEKPPTVDERPRYGGELDVGTVYVTLSALSWDPVDWAWKSNHDYGMVREQLFAGDLDKSIRKGGHYPFVAEAYLPSDVLRGELAERWDWEDEGTLVVRLRAGARFTGKAGVMEARELTAEDVVYTFNLVNNSPKKAQSDYWDYIDRVEARDPRTVVFHFNEFNAEWPYRFGYGYQSSILPREMADVDAKNWRNVVGTGPFVLERYLHGNSHTYVRNPDYWDRERLAGASWPIPFVDAVKYRVIKDEATYLTAIRTGKIDILEAIRWIAVDHLKETTPELKWSRWLSTTGNFVAMRMDTSPFDDVRVRRALNLAVDQREIAELFYGGHAEVMAYPQHPGFGDYWQPLEEMPPSVRELFEYHPEKARDLLDEAGVPEGFTFNVQVCTCNASNMDLIPLLDAYLAKVGVRMVIEPMEYASFLSMMTTLNHGPGYFMNNGHTNPTTSIRKFITGHKWNPALYSSEEFDAAIDTLMRTRDEAARVAMTRELTIRLLKEAPSIWLPTVYNYTAWWPWVKNYGGELRAGAVRPGPIYARIWIDEKLKREMGFE